MGFASVCACAFAGQRSSYSIRTLHCFIYCNDKRHNSTSSRSSPLGGLAPATAVLVHLERAGQHQASCLWYSSDARQPPKGWHAYAQKTARFYWIHMLRAHA
jgi:hypothetical protein